MLPRLIVILLIIGGLGYLAVTRTEFGQDFALRRGLERTMAATPDPAPADGLRVTLCGTSSPLPARGRAQACVAVEAGGRLFIVDTGAGSALVANSANLPLERLDSVLITHLHSDHIAELPEFNLNSWVVGRPQPLQVLGPAGIDAVVAGLNDVYESDRQYRVAHHGAELLPPALHGMVAETVAAGTVLEDGGLTISAFEASHEPVRPALGYRFDFGGRSVAITGDTVVTDTVAAAVDGVDLLLADALSLPLVQAMEQAALSAGRDRLATILADIQDYHADTGSLASLLERVDVGQLALYHLVPAPRNAVMRGVFRRGLPDTVILTDDGMRFDLPAGSGQIVKGRAF